MKKMILLFMCVSFYLIGQAQVSKSVNVVTAGTLSTLLTPAEKTTIANLTVTGNIDARDFKTMRDSMAALSVIDLDGVVIVGYSGTNGSAGTMKTYYAANEVPEEAFHSFNKVVSVKSVSISTSVKAIGDWAFYGCGNLISINIPSSVTKIGSLSFAGCRGLKSLNIPSSVNAIGDLAFYSFRGDLIVDPNNSNYSSMDGVLFNKDQTKLIQCPILKKGSYSIPNTVKYIGDNSFVYCSSLTKVSIPNSVISIGVKAFSNNTSLTSIDFSSSVNSIGESAFAYCTSLNAIVIPNSVTSIGESAFAYCAGLKSVTIPNLIASISSTLFVNCSGLTSIYVNSAIPVGVGFFAFFNVKTTTCTLYVPIGSKAAYQAATGWKDFTNIVEFDPTSLKETLKTQPNLLYNPATKSLQVSGVEGACSIEVYNSKGSLLLRRTLQGNEPFATNGLPKGVYVVRLTSSTTSLVKKISIR